MILSLTKGSAHAILFHRIDMWIFQRHMLNKMMHDINPLISDIGILAAQGFHPIQVQVVVVVHVPPCKMPLVQ